MDNEFILGITFEVFDINFDPESNLFAKEFAKKSFLFEEFSR